MYYELICMFKETVEVTAVTGAAIVVKFQRKSMCSCCKSTHICNINTEEITQIPNPNNIALKKGDKIEVGIKESKNLTAVCLLFLLPAVLFLLFLIFTSRWDAFLSFSVAILTLMLYYLFIEIIMKSRGKSFGLKILRKI